ncbi:MAG TPA: hypothetical protein VNT75_18335 [Symbiobacteriaceae bacterium]|nr:hypothetical protein [Symbiobacteriaceae bacterium]
MLDPTLALGPELEALLQRLTQVEASKWRALAELGLMPVPKGGATR